jgi:hypothetical protein
MLIMNSIFYTAAVINRGNGYALFAGGQNSANTALSVAGKYFFTGNVTSSATSLTAVRTQMTGLSSSVAGFFVGGNTTQGSPSTNNYVYTYASDTVATGTALVASRNIGAGASNATIGLIAGGYNGSYTNTTMKFDLTAQTSVVGTALVGTGRGGMAGNGNGSVGVFSGGAGASSSYFSITDVYTYSGDTTAAGTNLGTIRNGGAAGGSPTLNILGGGMNGTNSVSTTQIYNYGSGAVSNGVALASGVREELAAASNGSTVAFGTGGVSSNGATSIIDIYDIVNNACIAGRNLPVIQTTRWGSATTSSPGNF